MKAEAPFVGVLAAAACDRALCQEVLWGLEEEAVPGRVLPPERGDAGALARAAALASPLGLGIGLDVRGGCVLWHAGMPERPLLHAAGPLTPAQARLAGCAAARLAKRRPLPLDGWTANSP